MYTQGMPTFKDGLDEEGLNALIQMLTSDVPEQYSGPQTAPEAPNALLQSSSPEPSPRNFLRNESTGKMYNLDMAVAPEVGPIPDYSRTPVEVGGYGKGHWDKNNSNRVILPDGRTLLVGVDQKATSARKRETIETERKLLDNELIKANIAKANRPAPGPRLPMGQRLNANGELEWIPGSPGEIKAKGIETKASDQLAIHNAGTDALVRNIDQLIGNPDAGTSEHKGLKGSVGYLDAKLPPVNRDQATAQALIKGLLSKSAVSGLQQIRQSGTAPGSITEKEWPLFQNLIATLDPTQDEATFTDQLKELRRVAMESKARAQHGYETTFGNKNPATQSPAPPSAAAPAAPAAPQYVEVRVAADGRKIGKKADGTFEVVK